MRARTELPRRGAVSQPMPIPTASHGQARIERFRRIVPGDAPARTEVGRTTDIGPPAPVRRTQVPPGTPRKGRAAAHHPFAKLMIGLKFQPVAA